MNSVNILSRSNEQSVINQNQNPRKSLRCIEQSTQSENIHLFITDVEGSSFEIIVKKTDRIKFINTKFYGKSNATESFKYSFNGELLDDEKTFNDYQIDNQCAVKTISELRGGMKIFVKNMEGKTLSFEVQPKEPVKTLKYKIEEKTGTDPKKQKLVYKGSVLKDDESLIDYGIIEECTINLAIQMGDDISIEVKLPEKIVTLNVQRSDTVMEVKQQIEKIIQVKPKQQTLLFDSKILQDSKRLSSYNIEEGNVINVVLPDINTSLLIFGAVIFIFIAWELFRFVY